MAAKPSVTRYRSVLTSHEPRRHRLDRGAGGCDCPRFSAILIVSLLLTGPCAPASPAQTARY